MPAYIIRIVGPTGAVASEQVEAWDAGQAGQIGLTIADKLLDFGNGVVTRRTTWRVEVVDHFGDVLAALLVKR